MRGRLEGEVRETHVERQGRANNLIDCKQLRLRLELVAEAMSLGVTTLDEGEERVRGNLNFSGGMRRGGRVQQWLVKRQGCTD